MIRIRMPIDFDGCSRNPTAIDEARVIFLVREDGVSRADECGNRSGIGCEAGAEEQGRFDPLETCQRVG